MNSKKLYYCLIAVVVLLATGLIFGANEANSMLENKSAVLGKLKSQNQSTDNQVSQLSVEKKDISTYSNLNQIAESVVPQDKDQAETVREIVNLASQNGISQLSSISFPDSTLGGTSGTSTSSSSLTQVTPVKGIPDVYELPITVTQDSTAEVPYSSFLTFLTALEQNRRTALVNSVSVNPDQKNPGEVSFTIVIDEFIKP